MSSPATIAAEACKGQKLQGMNFADNIKKGGSLLKTLNINHCVTDSTFTNASSQSSWSEKGFAITEVGGGGEEASGESSSTFAARGTYTCGCSAVNAMLENYNNAVQDVKCIINQTSNSSDTSVTNANSLSVKLNDAQMDCTSFVVDQSISGKATFINQINDSAQTLIKNTIQDHINQFGAKLKNIYSNTPAYGPRGQGTANVGNLNSSSTQNTIGSQIQDAINNISVKLNDLDSTTLDFCCGAIFDSQGACVINQNIQVDIIANSIVSSAFQAAFQSIDPAVTMPPLPFTPPPASSSHTTLIIILVVVLLLIIGGGAYYYFVISKEKAAFRYCSL
jgi:hypothetical protein